MSTAFSVSTPRKVSGKWLSILGLTVLFFLLRWNNFNAPLIRDEGEYAYSAGILIQGAAPYQHAFVQKPPMVIYTYALAQLLAPHIFWTPRILAFLFIAAATVLLGFIARLEFGGQIALPAAWLMTAMILFPRLEQFPANTEMFMLLPLLGTVAIYCHGRKTGNRLRHWFWAGFLGATTLLYKYTAAPALAFLFVVWFWEIYRSAPGAKFLAVRAGALLAGVGLAVMLELGYFLFFDGGKSFWECTLLFNRHYAGSTNFGFGLFLANMKLLWESWWVLFLLPMAAIFLDERRIWFWFGMLTSAILCTSMGAYKQYYLILIPFWALLAAAGICGLAVWLKKSFVHATDRLPQLLTIAVMLVVLRPDVPWMICSPARFAKAKMDGTPFLESPPVAAKIVQLTSPNDFIFVAGSEPQILYYAQRYSPTRFITVYPLMIPTPDALHYQREAAGDLEKNPPKLIVCVPSPASWLRQSGTPDYFDNFFPHFLSQNYHLNGSWTHDEGGGHWEQSFVETNLSNADFVFYERNN